MRFHYFLLGAIALTVPVIGYSAPSSDRVDAVRQIAAAVGRVLGSATACREISPLRIKSMSDTLSDLITVSAPTAEESSSIWQAYNQSNTEGQRAIANRRITCVAAERALADLEKTVTPSQALTPPGQARSLPTVAAPAVPQPARPSVTATSPALAATSPLQSRLAAVSRGVTETEIRFGMSAPFSGSAKELGRQMKLGVETAFNVINSSGGVPG